MPTITTPNTPQSWHPDIVEYKAGDVVPDALIMQCTTVASEEVGADALYTRVPWVDDADATITPEGTEITPAEPNLSEAVITTAKITMLLRISVDQWLQPETAKLLSESARRAVRVRGNEMFVSQAAPTPPAMIPPVGIYNADGIIPGGPIGNDLDELVDLAAEIEEAGGEPSHWLLAPDTWAALRKLKTASGSNQSLLGAGTNDSERLLLDIPVLTTPAMPEGTGMLIDRGAIVSAVSPLRVARSEHQYFSSDSIAVRVAWRIGARVMHPTRVAKFTIDSQYGGSS